MAYAFDQTMQVLGLTDPDQAQGTTLASDEGAVGSSAQSNVPQAPQPPPNQPTAGGKNAIMQKNADRVQAPTDLAKINQGIGSARQSLQNEANSFIQGADDQYENISDEQLKSGIKGQAQGQPKTDKDKWLDFFNSGPNMVDPFKVKTDTKVKDMDLLKNDAGIRELFRRQQDPEGTIGESALDTALLRKNQGFNTARDAAVSDYENLQKERTDTELGTRAKAQEVANAGHNAFKDRVGTVGRGLLGEYDQIAAQREKDFDTELAGADASRSGNMQADAQSIMDEMIKSGNYDPELMQYLSLPENLSSYYSSGKGADATNASQFYTGQEASEWNNIMSLLKLGGETRSAAGSLVGSKASDFSGGGLDRRRLGDDLLSGATKRSEEAQAAKAEQAAATAAEAKKRQQAEDAYQRTLAQYAEFDRDREQRVDDAENRTLSGDEMLGRAANPLAALGGFTTPGMKATEQASKSVRRAFTRR